MTLRAFVKPGERVLIKSPCFDLLPAPARAAGANVEHWQVSTSDFEQNRDAFASAVRGVRMVMLTNPHNSTGRVHGPQQISRLVEIASCAGSLVLVDEVYGDMVRGLTRQRRATIRLGHQHP